MVRKLKLKIGDVYGWLKIIDIKPSKGSGTHTKAVCECRCGKLTTVQSHLLKLKIKSCGCNQIKSQINSKRTGKYKSLPKGEAKFNSIFYQYKKSAKKRNLEFNLTKEEFKKISSENCYYCGAEPKEQLNFLTRNGTPMYNGSCISNGIDRLNNNEGYTTKNSVSACSQCNFSKHKLDAKSYIEKCIEIAKKWNEI